MGHPIQILTVFDPSPARDTVLKLNGFLMARGATHDQDCSLLLHDTETASFDEVEMGVGLEASLERIYTWEALGSIEYWFAGGIIEVHFHTTVAKCAEAICISLLRGAYDREWKRYLHLSVELHDLLRSNRTILGYDLDEPSYFPWQDELARVKKQVYKSDFGLDLDLKFTWANKARD